MNTEEVDEKRCGTTLFYHSNTDEERHNYKLYTEGGRNVACKYCCLLAQEDEDVVV